MPRLKVNDGPCPEKPNQLTSQQEAETATSELSQLSASCQPALSEFEANSHQKMMPPFHTKSKSKGQRLDPQSKQIAAPFLLRETADP